MPEATPPPKPISRTARARKREAQWRFITLFVGSVAVVLLIAALVFVVSQRLLMGPDAGLDESDIAQDFAQRGNNWSGDSRTTTALFDAKPGSKDVESPAPPAPGMVGQTDGGILDIESKRDKIGSTVGAFFRASTLEARLPLVRDAERVRPLMEQYYKRAPMDTYQLRGLGWLVRVNEPGRRFGYVQALFEDATASSLVVEETASGEILIDWECLVRYGEVAWQDFLRLRPAQPTLMRLIASRSAQTPSGSNPTEGDGEWLELRHPAEPGTVLGYLDMADPKLTGLVKQLQDGKWKDVPVTLRLCFPEPPMQLPGGRVKIADVEGKGWLILNDKPKKG